MSKLNDIFCTWYLWPCLGPRLTTMQYVMYFRFVVDVMFSHNGANGIKHDGMFGRVHQVAAPGAKLYLRLQACLNLVFIFYTFHSFILCKFMHF